MRQRHSGALKLQPSRVEQPVAISRVQCNDLRQGACLRPHVMTCSTPSSMVYKVTRPPRQVSVSVVTADWSDFNSDNCMGYDCYNCEVCGNAIENTTTNSTSRGGGGSSDSKLSLRLGKQSLKTKDKTNEPKKNGLLPKLVLKTPRLSYRPVTNSAIECSLEPTESSSQQQSSLLQTTAQQEDMRKEVKLTTVVPRFPSMEEYNGNKRMDKLSRLLELEMALTSSTDRTEQKNYEKNTTCTSAYPTRRGKHSSLATDDTKKGTKAPKSPMRNTCKCFWCTGKYKRMKYDHYKHLVGKRESLKKKV